MEWDLDHDKVEEDGLYDGYYKAPSDPFPKPRTDPRHLPRTMENRRKFPGDEDEFRDTSPFCMDPPAHTGALCHLLFGFSDPAVFGILLREKEVSLSTAAIPTSLKSATVSIIEQRQGKDAYIKNASQGDFSDILKALDLNDIPNFAP